MSTPVTRSEEPVAPAWTVPPAHTWWRRRAFRYAMGFAVFAGLVVTPFATSHHLVWNLGYGWTFDFDAMDVTAYAAFLLLPFYRRASHRKRDLLIVALVPFYGQLVAAKIVSRLIALPRRDWTPRVDELSRVVRIPGGRGAYVLPPSCCVTSGAATRSTTTRTSPGTTRRRCSARTHVARVSPMDWTLEVVVLPVSDLARSIAFYRDQVGFALDHETENEHMHVAQLTPTGSGCSIVIGNLPSQNQMEPGSMHGLQLVVADAAAAREELVGRGVEASEITVFDERDGGTFFGFSDPDGNTWAVQQLKARGEKPLIPHDHRDRFGA